MALRRQIGMVTVLIYTFVITLLRTIRFPNDFSEALWLTDYRFGFVKRGLMGSLLSVLTAPFTNQPSELLIMLISFAVLAVLVAMLIMLSLFILRRTAWSMDSYLLLLAFASSPFIVWTAHLVGYLDHLIVIFAILSLHQLRRGNLWTAALIQAGGILVHESSLLIGFPLLIMAWVIGRLLKGDKPVFARETLLLLLPPAVFLAIALLNQFTDQDDLREHLLQHLSAVPFVSTGMSSLVAENLTISFGALLETNSHVFALRFLSPQMYALVGPSILAILGFLYVTYRIRMFSLESMLILAVCFAPQLINIVAWDTPRFWSISIGMAFLILWIYTELRSDHVHVSAAVRMIGVAAIGWNILVETHLLSEARHWLDLSMRVVLNVPVIIAVAFFALTQEEVPLKDRFTIGRSGR